ncbi:MAG: hypothetical protein AB7U20_12115 [Planctomycetaceae bacterium]
MLHFTCDLCGQTLDSERYTVRVDVRPAFDPDRIEEADLDVDHLDEIANTIELMESTGEFELHDCGAKSFRYDLCPHCRDRYAQDPLGQDSLRRLNFSSN